MTVTSSLGCSGTASKTLVQSYPTASCKATAIYLDASGAGTLAVTDVDNASADACAITNRVLSKTAFNCINLGTNTVTLTVTNSFGATASCTATVTVTDVYNFSQNGVARNATDGAAGDKMGLAIAFNGGIALLGAPEKKVGVNLKQGQVAMFNTPSWTNFKQLKASDGAATDYFGSAVAINGANVLIGANAANVGSNVDQGAAYIFSKDQGGANNWAQVKKLTASDGIAYEYFGYSVGLDATRAIVGTFRAKIGANSSQGAAYIFEKDQGGTNNWGQVKKLTASDGAVNHYLGTTVAQAGTLVAVGATGPGNNAGAVYLFAKDQGGANNWGQLKKLVGTDAATGDLAGTSLCMSSDYVFVGAPGKATYAGAVYVFGKDQGGANNWGQVKKLVSSTPLANNRFGQSVTVSGDYLYVGSIGANTGKGQVEVFHRLVGGVGQFGYIGKYQAADGAANDNFGSSVAADGTLLLVGAGLDDRTSPAATDIGSFYTYTGIGCTAADAGADDRTGEILVENATASPEFLAKPNPFSDALTLDFQALGALELRVTDAAGRQVLALPLPPGTARFELDTRGYRAGVYFVQVASNTGVRVLSLVKI